MPAILTSNAQIMCIHGGQLMLHPTQATVQVEGGFALCVPDLLSMPILGCPQAGPGIVPCTLVVVTEPVIMPSPTVLIEGRPAYVVAQIGVPGGVTNGVPPGMIVCVNPGQVMAVA
jgi:hypothetical protein